MRLLSIIFFSLHFLLLNNLFSEENHPSIHLDQQSQSVELTEGLPSNIVNNTVSVISGEYIDNSIDITLPGPCPLVYARTYSSFIVDGTFFRSWNDNQRSIVEGYDAEHEKKKVHALTLRQAHGSNFTYKRSRSKEKDPYELILPKGFTNGSTTLSARMNIRNTTLEYDKKKKAVTSNSGDGHVKTYVRAHNSDKDKKKISEYLLVSDSNPRNHVVHYRKDTIKGMQTGDIKIKGKKTKTEYSSLTFKKHSDFKLHPKISMETSDGRTITYKFKKYDHKVEKEEKKDKELDGKKLPPEMETVRGYYLKEVIKPHAPNEEFEYTKRDSDDLLHITCKNLPKDRFLETEYYERGKNELGGPLGTINLHKYDFRTDRVKKQKAPVGIDEKPITIYRFDYHAELKKHKGEKVDEVLNGSTDVYDAYWHKTTYEYNKDHRLKRILKYSGKPESSYSNYSYERFFWGREGTLREGNLTTKYLADWKNFQIHHGYHFFYDDRGNTTLKTLFGKLTGNPYPNLIIDANNLPAENGYERENITYDYSNDGLNLILKETDSNGKETFYQYYPGTDLLKSKYIKFDGMIQLREFYFYDADSILVKKISDNSRGWEEDDWGYINHRYITYYHPQNKIPYGLYKQIDEKYYDFTTNQEVLLKQTFNEYFVQGHLKNQKVYDANGYFAYETSWDYDEHGNVIKEINPKGEITTKTYDENDNLITQKGPYPGYSLENSYDCSNRLYEQKEVHSDGTCLITKNQYNYLSQLIASTDAFGNVTEYIYNDVGLLITKKLPEVPNELGALTKPVNNMQYDIAGNVTQLQDALGRTVQCEYNIRGKPLVITYPDNTQERFYYRLDGQLTQKVSQDRSKVIYTLDALGRPTKEEMYGSDGQLAKWIERKYNGFSLLSEKSSDGMTIIYGHEHSGRLVDTARNNVLVQKLFYDSLGRINRIHDWYEVDKYQVTIKSYDQLNRVIEERIESQEGKLLHLQAFEYDCLGNKTMIKLGDQATRTTYNSYKKPVMIVDALGNTARISYKMDAINDYGQCVLEVTTTDPLGNQTIEQYDTHSRLTKTTRKNAFNHILSNQKRFYDLCGNCVRVEDDIIYSNQLERRQKTIYRYDLCHRLETLIEAFGTPEQKITVYHYNHVAQKVAKTKPDGIKLIYAYDNLGRVKELRSSDHTIHYLYQYDQKDNVTEVTDLLKNTSNHRSYNLLGQLIEETFDHGLQVKFSCDLFDRNTSVTLPDQSKIEYLYNASHLKEVRRIVNNQKAYSHYNEDYNNAGMIKRETRPGKVGTQTYQYDKLNRCSSLQTRSLSQTIPADGFDAAGNLKKYQTNEQPFQFSYDDLYQITSEKGHINHLYSYDSLSNRRLKDEAKHEVNNLNQALSCDKDRFIYDSNGNLTQAMTSQGTTTYTYDALDRLTSVTTNGITTTYTYDSFHRRLSKQTGQNAVILYFYQDIEEIGSWDNGQITELKVLNQSNRKSVAIELNQIPYVPVQDLFGHVIQLLDLKGQLQESYCYSVFGEVEILDKQNKVKKTTPNPWLYSNRRLDQESGLFVFNLRYYDPRLGRWISPDPAGFEDGPNLYAHVHNNPLKYYDLLGLMASEHDYTVASANLTSQFISGIKNSFMSLLRNPDPHDVSGFYSINTIINPETGNNFNYAFNPKIFIITGNGIFTNKNGFDNNLIHCAKLTNQRVFGIFDQTQGFFPDCFDYKMSQSCYHFTDGAEYWYRSINYICENFPKASILAIPHSRSCTNLRNSLIHMPKDIRNRIDILAIAPGSYIHRDLCKSVLHLVCKGDLIPKIDVSGRITCQESIIELDSADGFPSNHYLDNPVYERPIKIYVEKFMNQGIL